MSPATPSLIDDVNTETVRAAIDTQDYEFISPIREFLEEFGCHVSVNKESALPVAYHIVCGGGEFVKDLLKSVPPAHQKRLVIVWNGIDPALHEYDGRETKIVLTDPKPLSGDAVENIFSFFFTSPAAVLDLRTQESGAPAAPPQLPVLVEEPAADVPAAMADEDKKRIQSLVTAMFAGDEGKKKEKRKKRRRPSWIAAVAGAIVVLVLPFVWYAAAVFGAGISFVSSATFLAQGRSRPASLATAAGQTLIRQSRTALAVAGLPFRLVGAGARLRVWERLVSVLSDVAAGQEELIVVAADANALAQATLGSQGGTPEKAPVVRISSIRRMVSSVANRLGLAQAQLHQLLLEPSGPFSWASVQSLGRRAETSLSRVRQQVALVDNLLTVYPSLAGFDRKKTYLLLFQNSAELRPTGGFIGSLAVVAIANGMVADIAVQDVYSVDGQLRGHVDPPAPVRELLAQEHWYLRDSNWDPDFRASGRQAAWFYEKETGVTVDGVIAITTGLVSDLLRVIGPLDLPDYPDRITADNFLGKAIFYTQNDFFPGSTQKKDFLGSVTRAMLAGVTSGKRTEGPLLVTAIARGLVRRDIQLYVADSQLEAVLEHYGWSGRVFGTEGCAGAESAYCLFDPLAVAEANVSVNKANAFIKRQRVRQVVLGEDGSVSETLTLSWANPSHGPPQDAGGSYRPYLQFVLPPDAADVSVTTGGLPVPKRTAKQAVGVPYWEVAAPGSIGVVVDVPSGAERSVSFSWRRGTPLVFGADGATYELYDQKQAGVADETQRTIIRYPIFWQAIPEGKEGQEGKETFLAKEAQLEYNTAIPGDTHVRVVFRK